MIRISGILKIIFFILIIVIFVELGYYIYFQRNSPNNFTSSNILNPSRIISVIPTDNPVIITTNLDPNQAINENFLRSLRGIPKGVLKQSIINNIYQGTLTEIDKNGGVLKNLVFPYKLAIKIKGDSDSTITFYFNEIDLKKIELVTLNGQKETPIQITDLNLGDKIMINESYDMTKGLNDSLIKSKITKI